MKGVVPVKVYVKPVFIRRIKPVLQDILKLRESAAGMIEDAVQINPDAGCVQCVTDCSEIFVRSKSRVDLLIISCIIPMCVRLKYRPEIDRVNMKLLQMVNPVHHFQDSVRQDTVVLKRCPAHAERINLIHYAFFCPHTTYLLYIANIILRRDTPAVILLSGQLSKQTLPRRSASGQPFDRPGYCTSILTTSFLFRSHEFSRKK